MYNKEVAKEMIKVLVQSGVEHVFLADEIDEVKVSVNETYSDMFSFLDQDRLMPRYFYFNDFNEVEALTHYLHLPCDMCKARSL